MPRPRVSAAPVEPIEEDSFGSGPDDATAAPDVADATSPDDFARTVVVQIRGKSVSVTYDLGEMTPRLRRRLTSLEDEKGVEEAIAEYVATLVTAWDITDRHGKAIPLADADAVAYRDLFEIFRAIEEDLRPNV